jgi:hypothetical protein
MVFEREFSCSSFVILRDVVSFLQKWKVTLSEDDEAMLEKTLEQMKSVFGGLARAPHRATLRLSRVWRPNRPPRVWRAAAPTVPVQTGSKSLIFNFNGIEGGGSDIVVI